MAKPKTWSAARKKKKEEELTWEGVSSPLEDIRWVAFALGEEEAGGDVHWSDAPSGAAWGWFNHLLADDKARNEFYRVTLTKLIPTGKQLEGEAAMQNDHNKILRMVNTVRAMSRKARKDAQ